LIYTSNWRVSPSAVEDMRIRLKEVVREKDPTTIVFHMLDNSTYYGRAEDGSCYAPRCGDDGIYHVEGEVYLCGRDTLLQHFNTIKPLLDLSNKRRGIVISPMPGTHRLAAALNLITALTGGIRISSSSSSRTWT
jgi:hypothetical protein